MGHNWVRKMAAGAEVSEGKGVPVKDSAPGGDAAGEPSLRKKLRSRSIAGVRCMVTSRDPRLTGSLALL